MGAFAAKLFEADPKEIAKVLFLAQQSGSRLELKLQERAPVSVRLVRGPEPGIWLLPAVAGACPYMGEPCCLVAGPQNDPWHIHTVARRTVPTADGCLIEIDRPTRMVRNEERLDGRVDLAEGELQAHVVQGPASHILGVHNASWGGIGARFLRPLFVGFEAGKPCRLLLGPGAMNLEAEGEVRWFSAKGIGVRICWPEPHSPPEAWVAFLRRAAMSRLYRSLSGSR